jgi:hypothetical protein
MSTRIFLVVAVSVVFSGTAALAQPYPGITFRTNSATCVSKFQSNATVISGLLASPPSMSGVQRLDVLTGGISSTSAFTALADGTYSTQLYSMQSTYADPTNTAAFHGTQSIGVDSSGSSTSGFSVGNSLTYLLSGGIVFNASFNFYDCGASSIASGSGLYFNKTVSIPSVATPSCSASINLLGSYPPLACPANSNSLQSLINQTITSYNATTFPQLVGNQNGTGNVTFTTDAQADAAVADTTFTSFNYGNTWSSPLGSLNLLNAQCTAGIYPTYPNEDSSSPTYNADQKAYTLAQYRLYRANFQATGAWLNSLLAATSATQLTALCAVVGK